MKITYAELAELTGKKSAGVVKQYFYRKGMDKRNMADLKQYLKKHLWKEK